MIIFFLILTVMSFMSLGAETILRSVYKMKNFGFEKRFLNFHGKTIPIEDFFPHTISEALIFTLAFSAFALILSAIKMPAAGSVFCGVIFGLAVMYLKTHVFYEIFLRAKKEKLPEDKPDADDRAVCTEGIFDGGYGRIEFVYKGRAYSLAAMSANETDIEEGEEVTVVHKEKGICWVERIEEELSETEE